MKIIVMLGVFVLLTIGAFGQTATPAPTPADTDSQKVSFSAGARAATGYYGPAGDLYRSRPELFVWAQVDYKIKKCSAYVGYWGALAYQEHDPYVGVKCEGKKTSVDVFYSPQIIHSEKIVIHNLTAEVLQNVVERKKFSASLLGRIEINKPRKKDHLPGGVYLTGGVSTDTELGKGWAMNFTPTVVYDIHGAYGNEKGAVLWISGEFTKQFGKVRAGPGYECSGNLTTHDRPARCSGYFTIYW